MQKYRKKPIVIEAMQFTGGDSAMKIVAWALEHGSVITWAPDHHNLGIPTLEGVMLANLDDWIIKGIAGEFYPCKNNIFEDTYVLEEE